MTPDVPLHEFDAFGDAAASSSETASSGGLRSTKIALVLFWVAALVLAMGRLYVPVQPLDPGFTAVAAPAQSTKLIHTAAVVDPAG